MASTVPGHHFDSGQNSEVQQDNGKVTTPHTISAPLLPENFLNPVSLPQNFCFTQPSLSQGLSAASTINNSSPIGMIGFPLNQLTNQFVHQIPINQITTGVQGFPINPAILTMAGQGHFLQNACSQFSPLLMNPQQPIMTNALIGSVANTINSVTPLSILSSPMTIPRSITDNPITEVIENNNINMATSCSENIETATYSNTVDTATYSNTVDIATYSNTVDAASYSNTVNNTADTAACSNTVDNTVDTAACSNTVDTATCSNTVDTATCSNTVDTATCSNTVDTATCSNTVDTAACSNTVDTATCSNTVDTAACSNTVDTATCSNTVDTEACSNTVDTATCSNTVDTATCSNTDETTKCSNTVDTATCSSVCGTSSKDIPITCPASELIDHIVQPVVSESSNDSELGFGTDDPKANSVDQSDRSSENNASPELFGAEPLCNAFQCDDEVNSEIMRRYRRNMNSKKKKELKDVGNNDKEQIKKEYISDECGDDDGSNDRKMYSSIDVGDYNEDGVPIEYNEPDFVWEDYLQETGTTAVPPTAFKHVECSLQSGFVKGMKLEVPNKSVNGTYWVASVVMTCGQLLRLRYDGYEEDGTADFWCDLMTSEIHPIGWCSENNQTLQPPEAISDKVSDWKEFLMNSLTGARTAPSYLLDKTTGTTPIDQIKPGMKLEIQDSVYPNHVWLVSIIENVGGRLYLRYEGMETGCMDFWLFYLDVRLHPIGWCKDNNYIYKAPETVEYSESKSEDLEECLELALDVAKQQILPLDIFKDQKEIVAHEFEKGMKLEALHPITRNQIYPATVAEVIDKYFFIVELDDVTEKQADRKRICFSAYSNMPTIFPIHWCQWKGIKICNPRGWNGPEFIWPEYLTDFESKSVPESCFTLINEQDDEDHEFERGMKLEAVSRENTNQICAATITKIVGHLMWIHLDNSVKMVASHVEDVYSHNLYPVGWCESNGYQLKPPRKTGLKVTSVQRVAIVEPEKNGDSVKEEGGMYAKIKQGEAEGNAWCPKIYFNHKCFSGPYLSKFRIAELPKCVGPGPINLVMKEVLSMLINVAYKSCRVLREIQMDGPANPTMHQQTLKAKYKSKSYRAVVEICKMNSQLEDFCRQVCIKLECCPNLIGPHFIDDNCPENCSQLTKTKYTYYYGKKKKKVGRPPGGHSILESQKKVGRKLKKKLNIDVKIRQNSPDGDDYGDEDKASVDSDTRTVDSTSTTESKHKSQLKPVKASMRLKRKYIHHLPPPSDIRTRGEKRPRYSFERRTHKKIMISSSPYMMNQKSKSTHSSKAGHSKHSHHQPYQQKKESYSGPTYTIKKEDILKLETNPLDWTISNVVDFIKTTDCANISRLFKEQEIDGQALLLLSLPTVQEHLGLKLGPAIKLCHHIEKVKIAFYETFAK